MPLYEYVCEACGQRSEVLQRLGAEPLSVCPACSGKLRKLFSAPSFQFKGTGWYVTDYPGKSGGAAAPDGGEPSSAEVKPAEVKPAAGEQSAAKSAPPPAASPPKPADSKPAS
jgi:putative FmdB family regulatory protein